MGQSWTHFCPALTVLDPLLPSSHSPGPTSPQLSQSWTLSCTDHTMSLSLSLLYLSLASLTVTAHEYYPGQCPDIQPMDNFDWSQFATGQWFITQKFATRSTCLTYEFTTDELGFKEITQRDSFLTARKLVWTMNTSTPGSCTLLT